MPSRREQQFQAEVARMLREARELPDDAVRRIVRLLEDSRQEIVGRIAAAGEGSYTQSRLLTLQSEIDRLLEEFRVRATNGLHGDQARAFTAGGELVDRPLAAVNVDLLIGRPSRQVLGLAQGYSATLVTGVSQRVRGAITSEIQRSLVGGVPLQETINRIGRSLTGGETPSIFSAEGKRAAMIARNEVHRVLDMATDERLKEYGQRAKDRAGILGKKPEESAPRKRWRHTPQEHPRIGHLLMDNQIVAAGEKFNNPRTGIQLAFPHDPNAPASETINCKCFVVPAPPVDLRGAAEGRVAESVVRMGAALAA